MDGAVEFLKVIESARETQKQFRRLMQESRELSQKSDAVIRKSTELAQKKLGEGAPSQRRLEQRNK
jgi:hypothetical protein